MAIVRSFFLPCLMVLLSISSMASSAIVEHTFHVQNLTVKPLCKEQVITAVNGSMPGPTINVREGDSLVVHVVNQSPYNMTIHWHGVFQMMSGWNDGANMVTQCPIRPGNNFTYRFNITGQEGTLWWHAHVLILRATVHGALIIRPTRGRPYPFPKPFKEVPIFLGQWWNETVENLEARGFSLGVAPVSDAYLINGLPGDLYACSKNKMYKLTVVQGKRYLLRIINAGLNIHLYFKIANHNLTVVAQDASYTTPYVTDVVVLAPGQTVDALLLADQPVGSYFMASRPYVSGTGLPFTNNVTRALLVYAGSSAGNPVRMPVLPEIRDTPTAHKYFTNITGLAGGPHWVPVPRQVDEKMFITVGLGVQPCEPGWWCPGPGGGIYSGSMNNVSWKYPTRMSIQQAWYYNVTGVYTEDFPDEPPVKFDFTNLENAYNESLWFIKKATSVKVLKFNSVVEVVLQNTAFVTPENHPLHLHGFNFHILAQGFGDYDPIRDRKKFNFVNPQIRSTVAVPVAGWAVIRFTANNPGVWMFHCHVDAHLPFGIAMAFVVENGPTPSTTLPPPPSDLPRCEQFSDERIKQLKYSDDSDE